MAIRGQVWHRELPARFAPVWADTAATYALSLSVRHTQEYPYANLPIVVDLIGDSGQVARYQTQFSVTDGHGNWRGSGFGTLFQCRMPVAGHVAPRQARRIVVWLNLSDADSVPGVSDIGIALAPE